VPNFRSDLIRLVGLDSNARLALVRAVVELLGARLRLALTPTRDLIGKRPGNAGTDQQKVAEIGLAIRRMAVRVPWRATCLVQALAAQRWLARHGIASEIVLGARRAGDKGIDAHAWLKAGDRIVVGGDPASYQPFKRNQPR
jgi:hypothetical protein